MLIDFEKNKKSMEYVFLFECIRIAELCLFLQRIYKECSAKPISSLDLLHSTFDDDTLLQQQQERGYHDYNTNNNNNIPSHL